MKIVWRVVVWIILGILLYLVFFDTSLPHIFEQKKSTVVNPPVLTEQEKGYLWAEDNGIDDEKKCVNPSKAFVEGCILYVKDTVNDDLQDSDTVSDY